MSEEHSGRTLECTNCSGTTLVDTFVYVVLKNQGTAKKPNGAICLSCGKQADQGLMARKMMLARKAAELKDLERQAAQLDREQAELDEELFEENPVEAHKIVVTRAKEVAARKKKPS